MFSLRLTIGSTAVLMATSITTNAGGDEGEKCKEDRRGSE